MTDGHEPKENLGSEIQIISYLDGYQESFEQEVPLPEDLEKFLKKFNEYDLEEDIKERGRDTISSELEKVKQLVESGEMEGAFKRGIAIVQQVNPSVKIEDFPIYLIFAGRVTNARAMYGGIVLNLGNLVNKPLTQEQKIEAIESMAAHETVHRFIRQLGLKPEKSKDIDEDLLHTIWEEGLATTIETAHLPWHENIVNDSEFWIQAIRDWMNAKGDNQKRNEILNECYQRDSYKNWLDKKRKKFDKLSIGMRNNEEKFRELLTNSNGPAYHVGNVLWEKELKRGRNITELLMKGSGQIREWLEIEKSVQGF